ncbi:hypothetical protein F2Q70_00036147 [Brassica cretica]|uniref:Uncharacterized protein n=1 Tax=Brassica cretica TaxID=69181 RepID=A0A8S9JX46_BRACR|nr:hypothetical protein F2Q68_00031339 [Brassica cretica]KAF2587090.1 hypothetical protein F2Q70_00036147 [Brassica cretica]
MVSCRINVLGKFGRYAVTNPCTCSVATGARSLRSDRAWLELGCYVATKPCTCLDSM